MTWLIRLYPRAWRRRYGEELEQLLAAQTPSLRLAVDLIAGAVDARVNPQTQLDDAAEVAATTNGGRLMKALAISCRPVDLTTGDHVRSAAVLLISAAILALAGAALKSRFGENPIADAVLASAFPLAVIASMYNTYMRRYSPVARAVIMGGLAITVFLISLIGALLSRST